MTLTITMNERNLIALDQALKVKTEDYKKWASSQINEPPYARNIIEARYILDLATDQRGCCSDYDPKNDPGPWETVDCTK